jgi:hypothetical protein
MTYIDKKGRSGTNDNPPSNKCLVKLIKYLALKEKETICRKTNGTKP